MSRELDLSSVISSRICHDLISPIGAISNGLELLAMSGAQESEELSLISDSARTAAAALRFMRIAFGAGSATELYAAHAVGGILRDYLGTSRLSVVWPVSPAEISRDDARLILLLALAGAGALPLGGVLTIEGLEDRPRGLYARLEGRRVGMDDDALRALDPAANGAAIDPRRAPLHLLAVIGRERDLRVVHEFGEETGRIGFA